MDLNHHELLSDLFAEAVFEIFHENVVHFTYSIDQKENVANNNGFLLMNFSFIAWLETCIAMVYLISYGPKNYRKTLSGKWSKFYF